MKKCSFYFLLSSLTYFSALPPLAAQSVSGHVEAPEQVKQLVVYLQPEDSAKSSQTQKIHLVSQKDTEFHSPLTVIAVGDKVQWGNDESKEIDHNIFSLSPLASFDLGLGERGAKLEQVFKNTGVVNYYCSVHKNMEGKIIVLPNRYYQVLDRPGDFLIDNLPEGNWTLNAVVLHLRYKAEPIKLTVGKTPVKNLTLNIIKK
ncbi:MAG: cupredoxin domain-containing protein [Methylobacter sp.]